MKILMVCMGNICRSPMAEGMLRHLARARGLDLTTDSAGTINNHKGEAPDLRAQTTMRAHGIDISDLRARQVVTKDFEKFDLLLAMDTDNLDYLLRIAPNEALASKAKLLMDHAPDAPLNEVPDPYYGGQEGFEQVYHMVSEACTHLVKEIQTHG